MEEDSPLIDSDDEPIEPPRPAAKPKASAPAPRAPSLMALKRTPAKPTSKSSPASAGKKPEDAEVRYKWLQDIKDAAGVREGQPGYDPSTLDMGGKMSTWERVVHGKKKPLSDFEKQYWNIKRNFWDSVLFFKKGKFYELYEKDAEIGHMEVGCSAAVTCAPPILPSLSKSSNYCAVMDVSVDKTTSGMLA
jgi:DNA mismatch repair protein MSH6